MVETQELSQILSVADELYEIILLHSMVISCTLNYLEFMMGSVSPAHFLRDWHRNMEL